MKNDGSHPAFVKCFRPTPGNPVTKIGFSFQGVIPPPSSPCSKDESSHKLRGKEVEQDPRLDGTPSSRGQAAGEASWTLLQLKSQLLETASWTLA